MVNNTLDERMMKIHEQERADTCQRSRTELELFKKAKEQELKHINEHHKLQMQLLRIKIKQEKTNNELQNEILYQKTLESQIMEVHLIDSKEELEFHRGLRILKTEEEEEKKPN